MEMEIKNTKKGFTLIELLVAMAVFSLLIVGMTDILVSSMKSQRRAFALQEAQSNTRYVIEFMTKEIRMSKIMPGTGTGSYSSNNLTFEDSNGNDIEYRFYNNRLERRLNSGSWQPLTPTGINVSGSFEVRKKIDPGASWAEVTIPLRLQVQGQNVEEKTEIYTQVNVNSRSFDY
jgi:prepilin-type N-terminal cleavage/methylation domain-containing protein